MKAYAVTVVLKTVEAVLVKPSRSKRSIGNDWTITTDVVGWSPEARGTNSSGQLVMRPGVRAFVFKTSGARTAKKAVDLDFGTVIFSARGPGDPLTIRFLSKLTEKDPVFSDDGMIAEDLQLDFSTLGTSTRTVVGRVAAVGGDESGVMQFRFNIEVTVSESARRPAAFVLDDGPLESVEPLPLGAKRLEVRSVQPVPPGFNPAYVDPTTRIRLAQILNTIAASYSVVRDTITELVDVLTIDKYLPDSFQIGFLTDIQAALSKELQETLNKIELPEYPTGTASKTVNVTGSVTVPKKLLADGLKKIINDTLLGVPGVGEMLKDSVAPTIDSLVDSLVTPVLTAIDTLYRNVGDLVAGFELIETLEPRAVLKPKPSLIQTYPFEVEVRRFTPGDVGRFVTISVEDNKRSTAVNTPVVLVDRTIDVTVGDRSMRIVDGKGSLRVRLPESGTITGSYRLTGNYGAATLRASFVDEILPPALSDEYPIRHFGVFEDELRDREQQRHAGEADAIGLLIGDVQLRYLGQLVLALKAGLDIVLRAISLLEAVPVVGDIVANVLNFVLSNLSQVLDLRVIRSRGLVRDFEVEYNAVNDAVRRNNLRNAEQFPEQNPRREILR